MGAPLNPASRSSSSSPLSRLALMVRSSCEGMAATVEGMADTAAGIADMVEGMAISAPPSASVARTGPGRVSCNSAAELKFVACCCCCCCCCCGLAAASGLSMPRRPLPWPLLWAALPLAVAAPLASRS